MRLLPLLLAGCQLVLPADDRFLASGAGGTGMGGSAGSQQAGAAGAEASGQGGAAGSAGGAGSAGSGVWPGAREVCDDGTGDCNGDPADGCEADLAHDKKHCGLCGRPCQDLGGISSCVSGECSVVCDAFTADCDGLPFNGCEVDLRSDGLHCGSCANGCDGAACYDGTCLQEPRPLIPDPHRALGLSLSAGKVYWVESPVYGGPGEPMKPGAIRSVPVGGGTIEVVRDGLQEPTGVLAADEAGLVWQDGERLLSAAGPGGEPIELAKLPPSNLVWLALDGEVVYVTGASEGAIERIARKGGPRTTVVSNEPSPLGLHADEHDLYWALSTSLGKLRRAPKEGGAPSTVASGLAVSLQVAGDAANVYAWTADSALFVAPKPLGEPKKLAEGLLSVTGLRSDGEHVFVAGVTDPDYLSEGLFRVSVGGGPLVSLASLEADGSATFGPTPPMLALDEQRVYWIDLRGHLWVTGKDGSP